jgi:hypothetical protein
MEEKTDIINVKGKLCLFKLFCFEVIDYSVQLKTI